MGNKEDEGIGLVKFNKIRVTKLYFVLYFSEGQAQFIVLRLSYLTFWNTLHKMLDQIGSSIL